MQFYRQGDVLILNGELPEFKIGEERKNDPVILRGETTGHAHRLVEGTYKLYNLKEPVKIEGALFLFMLRAETEVRLFHETHPDQILPIGDFLIGRQGEWDWQSEARQNVKD